MTCIKLLIFDVGGTLVDTHALLELRDLRLLKELGIAAKRSEQRKIIKKIDAELLGSVRYVKRFPFFRMYSRALRKSFKLSKAQINAFEVGWRKGETDALPKVFPDAIGALKGLKNKYSLATLSNVTDGRKHKRELKRLGLYRLFDACFNSEDLGVRKPGKGALRPVLRRFNVRPEESMMIGDTPNGDIFGAKRLGIHAVLIDRRKLHFRFNESTRPDFEIISLKQLPKVLKELERGVR